MSLEMLSRAVASEARDVSALVPRVRLGGRDPPGRLLDVGCGTGLFLAVARRRGWTPFGIDDCAEATRHAREHFGLAVTIGDFEDFARDARHFDVITMWDIIEHARRPVDLLAAA